MDRLYSASRKFAENRFRRTDGRQTTKRKNEEKNAEDMMEEGFGALKRKAEARRRWKNLI